MFLAFLFGAFGAIVAEVLKRWQQWNDLPEKRFLALLKSIEFWEINSQEGIRLSRRRYSCTEGRPWVRIGSGVKPDTLKE